MTHFFLSVGTSQLDQTRLALPLKFTNELKTINNTREGAGTASHGLVEEINVHLAKHWNEIKDGPNLVIQGTNRFGAEITTLLYWVWQGSKEIVLKRQQGDNADRFYLLLSDTPPGRLAGATIFKFLEEVWVVHRDHLWMKCASGLNSNPRSPEEAREAVNAYAQGMAEALNLSSSMGEPGMERRFIVSGGYKSTIPVMDWFSLAYNIPLNYIFEEADMPVKDLSLDLTRDARETIRLQLEKTFKVPGMPPLNSFMN